MARSSTAVQISGALVAAVGLTMRLLGIRVTRWCQLTGLLSDGGWNAVTADAPARVLFSNRDRELGVLRRRKTTSLMN